MKKRALVVRLLAFYMSFSHTLCDIEDEGNVVGHFDTEMIPWESTELFDWIRERPIFAKNTRPITIPPELIPEVQPRYPEGNVYHRHMFGAQDGPKRVVTYSNSWKSPEYMHYVNNGEDKIFDKLNRLWRTHEKQSPRRSFIRKNDKVYYGKSPYWDSRSVFMDPGIANKIDYDDWYRPLRALDTVNDTTIWANGMEFDHYRPIHGPYMMSKVLQLGGIPGRYSTNVRVPPRVWWMGEPMNAGQLLHEHGRETDAETDWFWYTRRRLDRIGKKRRRKRSIPNIGLKRPLRKQVRRKVSAIEIQ